MQRLDILHPSIDDYLLDIIPERDEVLTEMEVHARGEPLSNCGTARWARLAPIGIADQSDADF